MTLNNKPTTQKPYKRPLAMSESLVSDTDLYQLILLGQSDKQIASAFSDKFSFKAVRDFRLAHSTELLDLRREQFEQGRLLLETTFELAIITLSDVMNNANANPSARVAAAKAVMEFALGRGDTQIQQADTSKMERLPNLLELPAEPTEPKT